MTASLEDEEAYWKHVEIAETLARRAKAEPGPQVRWERLADLLKKCEPEKARELDALRHYLSTVLGVSGGAFGLAHQRQQRFLLLQTSYALPFDRFPTIDIPTMTDPPDSMSPGQAALLDMLFIGRRANQPLAADELPEFYNHLPPAASRSALFAAGEKERRQDQLPVLHCTEAEVSFFLFAWRLLLRQLKNGGRSDWTKHLCHDLSIPESQWLKLLSYPNGLLAAACGEVEQRKSDFEKDVENGWRDVQRHEGAAPEDLGGWVRWEWENLGLLRDGIAHSPLCDTLSYAAELGMPRYQIQIGEELQSNRLVELAESWQQVVEHLFVGSSGAGPIEALIQLHRLARIPIMPYYYWTIFDRAGSPKEHLVFSVWESQETKIQLDSANHRSHVVAVALLGLQGTTAYHRTSGAELNADELDRRSRLRLHRIRHLFSVLSRSIVDEGYYGAILHPSQWSMAKESLVRDVMLAPLFQVHFDPDTGKVVTENPGEASGSPGHLNDPEQAGAPIKLLGVLDKGALADNFKALYHAREAEVQEFKKGIRASPGHFRTSPVLARVFVHLLNKAGCKAESKVKDTQVVPLPYAPGSMFLYHVARFLLGRDQEDIELGPAELSIVGHVRNAEEVAKDQRVVLSVPLSDPDMLLGRMISSSGDSRPAGSGALSQILRALVTGSKDPVEDAIDALGFKDPAPATIKQHIRERWFPQPSLSSRGNRPDNMMALVHLSAARSPNGKNALEISWPMRVPT